MNSFSNLRDSAHRADIDGLRGVAIVGVVGYHSFPAFFRGGFTGVDIFFVISGFLISGMIVESLKRDAFSFTGFYMRRIRRIFPALSLMLVAVYATGLIVLFPHEFRQLTEHIAYGAGFASNILLQRESGYFDNEAVTKPLLHLWSLGIEEQYYIVWPLLLWLGWRWRLNLPAMIVVVGIASFALNILKLPDDLAGAFYAPQTRFWELMIGSMLACLRPPGTAANGAFNEPINARGNLQSALGAALIFVGMAINVTPPDFPGWRAVIPTAGAALIIASGKAAWINRVVLSHRLLAGAGLLSYPLYLWHWPLLSFAHIVNGATPGWSVRLSIIAAAIGLAAMTNAWVERPLRYGAHAKAKAIVLLAMMTAIGLIGTTGFGQNRMIARTDLQNYLATRERIDAEFAWQYASNDLCRKRYPLTDAKASEPPYCMASSDAKPTLLLLGNSFANQLYPGLAQNAHFTAQSILNIGDCGATSRGSCGADYGLRQRRFIDELIERERSVKFAIIAGLGIDIASPEVERLIERIDRLEQHGIKVIVFTPHLQVEDITATPGFDIKTCFAGRPFQSAVNCDFDTGIRQRYAARFLAVEQRIQTTHPQVAFFEQNELFCTERHCRLTDDGRPLFRDHGHLSEHGSLLLGELFAVWAGTHMPELLDAHPVPGNRNR